MSKKSPETTTSTSAFPIILTLVGVLAVLSTPFIYLTGRRYIDGWIEDSYQAPLAAAIGLAIGTLCLVIGNVKRVNGKFGFPSWRNIGPGAALITLFAVIDLIGGVIRWAVDYNEYHWGEYLFGMGAIVAVGAVNVFLTRKFNKVATAEIEQKKLAKEGVAEPKRSSADD